MSVVQRAYEDALERTELPDEEAYEDAVLGEPAEGHDDEYPLDTDETGRLY